MSHSALQPSLFDETAPIRVAATPETATLRETAQLLRAIELLSAVTGMDADQARAVLKKVGGVHDLARLPEGALLALPHIGPKRAKQIRAMTKWALMLGEEDGTERVQIRNPADAAHLVMQEMGLLEREELRVIGLDTKNNVRFIETIYQGSINTAVVRIAEILRMPVALNCAAIVLAHNHPSGDPTPSPEDVRMTEMVRESGKLMEIPILDHIIIGRNRFVSLRERGLGFGGKD